MQWAQFNRDTNILDHLQSGEQALAAAASRMLQDETHLRGFAAAWRSSFDAMTMLPPASRALMAQWPSTPRGGPASPGTLGEGYPMATFLALRSAWSSALRTVAAQQAWWELDLSQRIAQIADAVDSLEAPRFAPTPRVTVHEGDGFRLHRLTETARNEGEPILVVASLINRWYILDFLPGKSFLGMLSELGRPVYLLEATPPKRGDDRSIGDLCAGPVRAAIDRVARAHGGETVSLIGYCLGGTLAAITAARYPEKTSRLLTICAPIRFSEGGLFHKWLSADYVDVDLTCRTYERVPAWLVHLPFWWLRPTIKLDKLVRLARGEGKADKLMRFLALDVWNHDNVDMARGVFRSWVGELYQKDALHDGTFEVDGERVSLADITCPVTAISAEHDAITPAASVEAIVDACGNDAARKARLPASHVSLFTSERNLGVQRSLVTEWLKEERK